MKKRTTLLLAGLLSVSMFASCGKVANSAFSGTYWLEEHSAKNVQADFYERVEYDVAFSEPDDDFMPNLYEMSDDYLNFVVDDNYSSYVTELYAENGLYVYHTLLTVVGRYTFGTLSYEVKDVTETITKFKGAEDNFACVESKKIVSNAYPVTQRPTSDKDFAKVNAEISVTYDGKKAVVTTTAKDEASKSLLATMQKPVTIKKYETNKKKFIDNELMLLLFRNFSYDNTLSYTFNTIDTSDGVLKEINGAARLPQATTDTTSQSAVRSFTIDSYIDDANYNPAPLKMNCFGVVFKTTGEYAQSFAYAYYAESIEGGIPGARPRHYMVKCFRPAIYNIGYFVYTIDTVTHSR